jgi:hypothetical protein
MNVKGIFLTISLMVLALGLIAFTQSAENIFAVSEGNTKYFSGIHRTVMKYENTEDNIIDIVENTAHLSFSIEDNALIVSEQLPDDSSLNDAQVALQKYRQFAMQYTDNLDVNISSDVLNVRDLVIEPYDIQYAHTSSDKQGELNQAVFTPGDYGIQGYVIDITVQNQPYQGITPSIVTLPSGGITLDIHVHECTGCDANSSSYLNVDPDATSLITIETAGAAPKDVNILISPGGILTVSNNNSVSIDLNTSIVFASATITPHIALPEGFVTIKENTLGVEAR